VFLLTTEELAIIFRVGKEVAYLPSIHPSMRKSSSSSGGGDWRGDETIALIDTKRGGGEAWGGDRLTVSVERYRRHRSIACCLLKMISSSAMVAMPVMGI